MALRMSASLFPESVTGSRSCTGASVSPRCWAPAQTTRHVLLAPTNAVAHPSSSLGSMDGGSSLSRSGSGGCEVSLSGRREVKRLAKALKSHRKRITRIMSAPATTMTAAPTTTTSSTSSAADLLAELRLLTDSLNHQLNVDMSSSSDDDDDVTSAVLTRRHYQPHPHAQHPQPTIANLEVPPLDLEELEPRDYQGAGRVLVCQGSKCQAKGATDVLRTVSRLAGSSAGVEIVPCKCLGKCKAGPAIRIKHEGMACSVYTELQPGLLPDIMDRHFTTADGPLPAEVPRSELPAALAVLAHTELPHHHHDHHTGPCCPECKEDVVAFQDHHNQASASAAVAP